MQHTNDEKWKKWIEEPDNKEIDYEMKEHQTLRGVLLKHIEPHFVILEAGSGSGIDLAIVSKKANKAYALDISQDAINLSKKMGKYFGREIEGVIGDIHNMPFEDNKFDLIFSCGVLQYFKKDDIITELKRILKPKGLLIIDVPYTYSFFTIRKKLRILFGKWPWGKEGQYTKKELMNLIESNNMNTIEIQNRGIGSYPNALINIDQYLPEWFIFKLFKLFMHNYRHKMQDFLLKHFPKNIIIVGIKNG